MREENLKYKLLYTSTINKLLDLFYKFPYNANYIDDYVNYINEDLALERRLSDQVLYNLEKPCYLNFYVEGMGSFYKRWTTTDDSIVKTTYSFDFYTYDTFSNPIEGPNMTNKNIKKVCECFLPFMLSQGKEVEKIPLLIIYHKELAKFAVDFNGIQEES
jgi:hypothetical protein